MPYVSTAGDTYHERRTCRRLHNTSGRIRWLDDATGRTPCAWCVDTDEPHDGDIAQLIEAGVCPFCDDYEGENVGQHAAQAHPDAWAEYSDG